MKLLWGQEQIRVLVQAYFSVLPCWNAYTCYQSTFVNCCTNIWSKHQSARDKYRTRFYKQASERCRCWEKSTPQNFSRYRISPTKPIQNHYFVSISWAGRLRLCWWGEPAHKAQKQTYADIPPTPPVAARSTLRLENGYLSAVNLQLYQDALDFAIICVWVILIVALWNVANEILASPIDHRSHPPSHRVSLGGSIGKWSQGWYWPKCISIFVCFCKRSLIRLKAAFVGFQRKCLLTKRGGRYSLSYGKNRNWSFERPTRRGNSAHLH